MSLKYNKCHLMNKMSDAEMLALEVSCFDVTKSLVTIIA